jgi:hypothetical protein
MNDNNSRNAQVQDILNALAQMNPTRTGRIARPSILIPVLIGPFDRLHTLKTLGVARL